MFKLPSIEIAIALEQSLEKLNEIVLRFHQLNNLEALLSYGVGVIQELLESDRTLIYQFLPTGDGVIIAESVKEDWQPIIGQLIYDPCFENHWAQQYHQGQVREISDVANSDLAPCHIEFLTQIQVKAYLVVPIIVRKLSNSHGGEEAELWGLLIVQQCSAPRIWQSLEVQVLKQLSLQLEIAIAHFKAQNQWQANLQKLRQSNIQQEHLQASLQQEQERWQLAIQGSNDGIWDWNILTDELFLSPRWKEMLGYQDDEIENSVAVWESHLHPEDLNQVKQAIQDHLIHKNAFFAIEQRMRCKDGSYKWILARAQAVWDETGRAIRMVGFHSDISDRKQAELTLQEQEETLRLLIKYAPANIAMFDQNMNYLMITQRGVDDCHIGSIESVLGRSHYEILPFATEWRDIHQRCLAGAIEKSNESLLIREDGTKYWTKWEIHPWYKPNQVIGGIILFIEDITADKQAEEELQRSVAELKRLHQLKDDFLSTVSHELRTPMSNIRMATQILEIQLKSLGLLTDESNLINRALGILDTECQREIKLINDLLNLTLLDAETELMNFTLIDLSFWVPHIAEPFIKQSQQHQQRLSIEISPDIPTIRIDLSYVERIVTELLNNAIKYTPPGEEINLLVQASGETIDIVVRNSGVEIAAVERDRIFDKFYRIPNHDPWKYGGTGLGLSLVKKMVNCLGGTISVISTSQPSMTTFIIHLPIISIT